MAKTSVGGVVDNETALGNTLHPDLLQDLKNRSKAKEAVADTVEEYLVDETDELNSPTSVDIQRESDLAAEKENRSLYDIASSVPFDFGEDPFREGSPYGPVEADATEISESSGVDLDPTATTVTGRREAIKSGTWNPEQDEANAADEYLNPIKALVNGDALIGLDSRIQDGIEYSRNEGAGLTIPYESTSESFLAEHPEWIQENLNGKPMIQIASDPVKRLAFARHKSVRPGSYLAAAESVGGIVRENTDAPLTLRPVKVEGVEIERQGAEARKQKMYLHPDLVTFLLVAAEDAIAKSMYADALANKDNLTVQQQVDYKDKTLIAKNRSNGMIGGEAIKQFWLSQGRDEEADSNSQEATTLGDYAQELLYSVHGQEGRADNNGGIKYPLLTRIPSVKGKGGEISSPIKFALTELGHKVFNNPESRMARGFLLRKEFKDILLTPPLKGDNLNSVRGAIGGRLSKKAEEARFNLSSISFKINNKNLYILFQLLIPFLKSRQDGEGYKTVFEKSDESKRWKLDALGIGQAKINEITASIESQQVTEYFNRRSGVPKNSRIPTVEQEYDAAVLQVARVLRSLARAQGLLFYFNTAIQGFSGRIDLDVTHLNPQALKIVRGALANPVVYPIRKGNRSEALLRQMFALNFAIKAAEYYTISDGKVIKTGLKTDDLLFKERDRNLEINSNLFEEMGDRVIEVFDLVDNFGEDLIGMKDGIFPPPEKTVAGQGHVSELVKNPVFTGMNSPTLDPNNELDAKLISAIKEKGIESIAFLKDLSEFSKYRKWKRENTDTPFYSTTMSNIDGKTSGAFIIAALIGNIDNLYKTGMLRSQGISILDNGDLRDQLISILLSTLESEPVINWDYPKNLFNDSDGSPNSELPYLDIHNISVEVFKTRGEGKNNTMAKHVVMTEAFGKERDSYKADVKNTIDILYRNLKSSQTIGNPHPFVTSYDNLKKNNNLNAVAHMVHKKYMESYEVLQGDDAREYRSILRTISLSYQLMNTPELIFMSPDNTPLTVGLWESRGWDDSTSNSYSMTRQSKLLKDKGDEDPNKFEKISLTVGQWETKRSMTAYKEDIDPVSGVDISMSGGDLHSKIISKVVHSIDAAVFNHILTGKTFSMIGHNSGGNPFMQMVYDAIYLDIGTFDTVLREVNRAITDVIRNYNIFQQLLNSLQKEHTSYMKWLNKQNPKERLTDEDKRFFVDLFSYNSGVPEGSREYDKRLGSRAKFRHESQFNINIKSFMSHNKNWLEQSNNVQTQSLSTIRHLISSSIGGNAKYNFDVNSPDYISTVNNLNYGFLQELIPIYFSFLYGKNFSRLRNWATKTHVQKMNALDLMKKSGYTLINQDGSKENIANHYSG